MDSWTKEWLWSLRVPVLLLGIAVIVSAVIVGVIHSAVIVGVIHENKIQTECDAESGAAPPPPPEQILPEAIQGFQEVFIEDNFSVYSTEMPFDTPWLTVHDSRGYEDVPGKLGGVFCGFYSVTMRFTVTVNTKERFLNTVTGRHLYLIGNNNVIVLKVAEAEEVVEVDIISPEGNYFYTILVTANKIRVE